MSVTDKTFEGEVLRSEIPVLVEFWGSWCPPCQMMKENMEKLEVDYKDRVKIVNLNVDRNPRVASRYRIKGVPCWMLLHRGEEIHRDVGAKSTKQIHQMIGEAVEKIAL